MNNIDEKKDPELYARAFLEDMIARLSPGERLPGLRELMQRSQLGRIRLKRVLDEMVALHRLELRDRSGFYRLQEPPQNQIAFIYFSNAPLIETKQSFPGGIVYALRQEAEKQQLQLKIINAVNMSSGKLSDLLRRQHVKTAFIMGGVDANLTSLLAGQLPQCISLLPHHTARVGNELRDSPDMTQIQLKYLFQCNYRRIGYIHNVDEDWNRSPVQLQRLLDYYRIMAEHGLKVEPEWVFYCGYTWEHFNNHMHKMMRLNKLPDALIVPGSALKYIYRFCSNNGIAIGRELAVIGCDDTAPELTPRATSVTNTPFEIGKQAWQLLQRCQSGRNLCEYTQLQIVTGETVRHHDQ
ncbi:MAG: GntR family transcriptional regulator [Lentisphaerae bacterium]|nr:GntR family transcriptional regulator [Lentisphaerota bacterium]